jgi:hypothetical protein
MKVDTGKLQILTVAAMLVLVSGGIAAYAQNQSLLPSNSANAPNASNSSATSSTSSTPVRFDAPATGTTFTTTVTTTVTLTTTTSTTTTTTGPATLCTPPTTPGKPGKLVLPITPVTQPTQGAISFSDGRGCLASITTIGGIFSVEIALRYAKPVTQYNVVLVANGTSYTLGNMVTGPGGTGQLQNQVLLKTGTYIVSLQIYDTSSTPGTSTLVLQTGQGTIVSPPFPTPASNSSSSTDSQSGQGDQGQSGHKR